MRGTEGAMMNHRTINPRNSNASAAALLRLLVACTLTVLVASGCRTDPTPIGRSHATQAFLEGDYEKSLALNRRHLERYPQSDVARYDAGRALMKLGRHADAASEFDLAVALRPENTEYLEALLEAEFLAGRYDRITTHLRKRLNVRNDYRDALRLGKYHELHGAADDALVAYQQAIIMASTEQTPARLATRVEMSDFFGRVGDREKQVMQLRYALGIDPRSEEVRARLGRLGIIPGPDLALDPRLDSSLSPAG